MKSSCCDIIKANRPRKQLESSAPLGFAASGIFLRPLRETPIYGQTTAMQETDTAPRLSSVMEQRQTRIARWAALAVLGWMFLPLVTGRIYICDDLLNYHLPLRVFYAQCLQNGEAFDWMPGLFCGFFLTGSGQAGTYHPWHWLLYRWLPLETAFNLEILSSFPFMLFGMQLFLKRQLQRSDAAWLGAIVFTFSGFCTLHFLHPNALAVVSHIPWLLLVHSVIFRRGTNSGRIAAESGIALLTASQLLLGYPQYVWYSLLAEIIFCLSLSGRTWRSWRCLLLIGLLKLLGLAMGAVQILPSMDALADSDRATLPPEYFFQFPLTLPDMLQWVAPFLTKTRVFGVHTHELGLYCGALPVLLAVVAIKGLRKPNTGAPLLRAMIVLCVIGLWLSFGKAGGLYVVQTWLPLIGKFRWPSRSIVLMHFAVATMAAIGYARIAKSAEAGEFQVPKSLVWIPWLSAGATIGVWFACGKDVVAPWTLLMIGPILFALGYQMLKDLSRGKVSAGFMLFVAGDLAAYGFTYEALTRTASMDEIRAEMNAPPGAPSDGRIVAEIQISERSVGFEGNELLLLDWQQADGYDGLLPQTWLLNEYTSLNGLRISGVRWITSGGRHPEIPGLLPTTNPRWLEVPDPLPRARLTGRLNVVSSPHAAVRDLSAAGPTLVDREISIAMEDTADSGSRRSAQESARLSIDRPGRVTVLTESADPRFLVLAVRFSRGWRATVNDTATDVVRAELDFMGCVVPAGRNTVQFRFEPTSVTTGRRISLLALLLLAVYVAARVISTR